MHILIITLFYAPDIGPSAPLFTLLSEALVQRGHEVDVIAAVPHFSSGKVSTEYKGIMIRSAIENNVNITRIPVPSVNRSKLRNRMIQFVTFQIGATIASITKKYDVALIINPAIETFLPFAWQAFIRRKPTIWSVFDVYPDVGIKLGIFRSKIVISFVKYFEQICLKYSTGIHIISNSFRESLYKLGVPESKMITIPIWVDTKNIRPMEVNNNFAKEYQLEDLFVVLYAGNIGLSQGLENVLVAAENLKSNKNLCFVFVGNGLGLESLQNRVQQRNISNVKFIPFQPRKRLPEVLATAGASLIILKRGIGSDSLPSKTFSALASGRPIIASVDQESETWQLIQQSKSGLCIPPEDPTKITEAIQNLMRDPHLCNRLGCNGRKWAEKYHSVFSITEQFEHLFIKALTTDIS